MALDSAAENASRKASAQQVLTRSRQRVSDHGEVFTPAWMTEAMLDLVKAESERIDSRFLESACGSGNFLVPVLRRKLAAVHLKYAKSDFEKHQHALLALMCIYGVELLADNVEECRNSLLDTLANYLGVSPDDHIWRAARAVLELNIVHGDALTTTNTGGEPIVFTEWVYLGQGKFQRRDFDYKTLTQKSSSDDADFFDVVIGNPPYQLTDGGGRGTSASPLYHHFVNQAKAMRPRYICMVIPARWYSAGKGLDEFRAAMLNDKRVEYLADFPDSRDAFPDVDVAGGVCYFLWDRDSSGPCRVETFSDNDTITAVRDLNEFATFVRDSRSLSIVHKVRSAGEASLSTIISSRKPFGIESADPGDSYGRLRLYKSRGDSKYRRSDVTKGLELIDKWKVLVSKTSSEHAGQTGVDGTKRVLSRIEVMSPGSVCTESYLIVGPFETERQASSAASYLRTKFARYLLSSILLSQNISKGMFEFVPVQQFTRAWVDEDLYEKYGLEAQEIDLIDQSIRSIEMVEDG
ncbi:MAG: Eco57I restriction-modification methylase domain-containing protein [Actinomycetota bacterium]|nr:Eco57I restriction-modification methylase domain-containing protein [Actinomycetota bacterium]